MAVNILFVIFLFFSFFFFFYHCFRISGPHNLSSSKKIINMPVCQLEVVLIISAAFHKSWFEQYNKLPFAVERQIANLLECTVPKSFKKNKKKGY